MVGIVLVSHSAPLAEGVVELAREMGGEDVRIEAAGGLEEPEGALGTDVERVRAAIERAMSDDGVLVLMDLGSAIMSAEMAAELLEGGGRVVLSDAPLVEGAVAAAAAARGGASLDEVAAEARGAIAMKRSQLAGDEAAAADQGGDVHAGAAAGRGVTDQGGDVDAGAAAVTPDAEARLTVANAIGLHARPAARFVEVARSFDADVRVVKAGGAGEPVSAKSLTALVTLGARLGDELLVTAAGPQAADAVAALEALAREGFGDGVAAPGAAPAAPAGAGGRAASPAAAPGRDGTSERDRTSGAGPPEGEHPLVPAPGTRLRGVPGSPGVAVAPARHLRAAGEPPERDADSPEAERRRLDEARAAAGSAIERDRSAIAERAGADEAAIFEAHLALLDDAALVEPAHAAIDAGATAERAWHDAAVQVAATYRALDDPLLRERAADVLDVGRRVVAAATGEAPPPLAEPGIVLVGELTPADAAGLDVDLVRGIATARGTATSHGAILARALGLPAVLGLGDAVLGIDEATPLLLDGDAGTLHVGPPDDVVREAEARAERDAARRHAAVLHAGEPATTRDGERVEVFANLGAPDEAQRAVELGAEGVGLLRTEFLFLDRAELPDEDEQVETLHDIARALDGRPLVVRTLDAGADKPLPSVPMPAEANPFLGRRGIRLTLDRPDILRTQLRAILRVAAEFPLKVMFPMVATVEEVRSARALLEEARAVTGVDPPLEVGIMVEVPAVAVMAERLAAHVDFFSLGTNDLTQYTMAAERGNEALAALLEDPQPAVLRLVHATVVGARRHGRWVGVCGELAGDPVAAVLLAGLGVTELSMAPTRVPEVKAALREVELAAAREAAQAALDADSASEVRTLGAALL